LDNLDRNLATWCPAEFIEGFYERCNTAVYTVTFLDLVLHPTNSIGDKNKVNVPVVADRGKLCNCTNIHNSSISKLNKWLSIENAQFILLSKNDLFKAKFGLPNKSRDV